MSPALPPTDDRILCKATSGRMQLIGYRFRSTVHQHGASAVNIATCSVDELRHLQRCCKDLLRTLAIEEAQRMAASITPSASGAAEPPALTKFSLAAHHDASSCPRRVKFHSLPDNLDCDDGLWQTVHSELFPSRPAKLRPPADAANVSSREDNAPSSPSMLSVVTAPSDGGTTRGQPSHLRHTSRAHSSTADPQNTDRIPAVTASLSQCEACPCSADERSEAPTTPCSCTSDSHGPDSHTGPSQRPPRFSTTATRSGVIPLASVTPIPECNSSLETNSTGPPNSSRLLRHSRPAQPCDSVLQAEYGLVEPDPVLAEPVTAVSSESTLQVAGGSNHYSGSSQSGSSRSRRRRNRRDGGAPLVMYGFPSSPGQTCVHQSPDGTSARSVVSAVNSPAVSDEIPRPDPGQGSAVVRRAGLLSASLGQKNRPPGAETLSPSVAAAFQSSAQQPNSTVHGLSQFSSSLSNTSAHNSRTGSFVHGQSAGCSPAGTVGGTRGATSVRVGTASSATGALGRNAPSGSTVIPVALHAEMASLGFHRPQRVTSTSQRDRLDDSPVDK